MAKAFAEYREASARRHDTLTQEYFFDSSVPKRSSVQKRLSIYNWNPGPRRGKEGAIEKRIAGQRHIITLQESTEYVDHELLTNRFHVTHYGRCVRQQRAKPLICSKEAEHLQLEPRTSTWKRGRHRETNCRTKAYYHRAGVDRACRPRAPHEQVPRNSLRTMRGVVQQGYTRRELPDKVKEGDSGCFYQGVLSRASFCRQPLRGRKPSRFCRCTSVTFTPHNVS